MVAILNTSCFIVWEIPVSIHHSVLSSLMYINKDEHSHFSSERMYSQKFVSQKIFLDEEFLPCIAI